MAFGQIKIKTRAAVEVFRSDLFGRQLLEKVPGVAERKVAVAWARCFNAEVIVDASFGGPDS